MPITSQSIFTY